MAGVYPLISAPELAALLAGTSLPVLLDVRWQLGGPPGVELYRAGHLPGAHYLDLDRDLAGPPGPTGRHPLPPLDVLGVALRRAGVTAERDVIAYDGMDGIAAARAWWLLRWAGHRRVRVLDGGYRAWTAAGYPTETPAPPPASGDFQPVPGSLPVLDAASAAALARTGLLLDARSAQRYRGEVEPVDPVAGHIPGAVSAPAAATLSPDGRFRARDELVAHFTALGASQRGPVGTYCGSGVTAAHQVLALELAGVPAALYVGSWSEWVADPRRPVGTGPDPG
ncbi:MAG TPA: sulfurtransferase [Mycobacteriales bacterium]|nr:sulfurtransferase [Mycobacteriales bacterium]